MLSEVNTPNVVLRWLYVLVKDRGEEKRKGKHGCIWLSKQLSPHYNCSRVSDPQVRRLCAMPWLSSQFLVTLQHILLYITEDFQWCY